MFIHAEHAVYGYGARPVVRVDALHVHAGRCLGVFGPNGSGKTTLVRGLSGLLPAMSGAVQRAAGLRIGYLQQYRGMELQWPMSGFDAAAMAVSARCRLGWMGRDALRRVRDSMHVLEVSDLAQRSFASLSGGQRQRVLLASALATQPQVLILDEPTEGLDMRSRRIFLRALRDAANAGLATIMISHAIDDLATLADEVAWLHEAELPDQPNWVEIAPVSSVLERVLTMRQSA